MNNRLSLKRKSVLFTWMFSYGILLISFIVTSIFSYFMTKSVIEDEIIRSNRFVLSKAQQYMDNMLDNMQKLGIQIVLNDKIEKITKFEKPLLDSQYFDIHEVVNELKIYKTANNSIDYFYIYLSNIDMVISPTYCYNREFFYGVLYPDNIISEDDWYGMASKLHKGEFITLPGFQNKDTKEVAYVISMPLPCSGEINANVVVQIDESKLIKDTEVINDANNGITFIMDSSNNIITSSSPIAISEDLKYSDMTGSNGTLHIMLDNKEYIVSYTTSQITKWKYVSVIPTSIFWEKSEYARKINLCSVLLCSIIGIIIIFVFCRLNYNPVSGLVKMFSRLYEKDLDDNEYIYIQKAISKTLSYKEEIDKKLRLQNKILKENFMERLLKGKIKPEINIEEMLISYSIIFNADNFAVVLFYVDSMSGYEEALNIKECNEYIVDGLQNNINNKYRAFVNDSSEGIVCLFNITEENLPMFREDIAGICEDLQYYLKNVYNTSFTYSVSSIHKNQISIPVVYNEALEVMEYKKMLGMSDIIFFDDIKEKEGKYYYPLDKEQQLINCIKAGKYEDAKKIIEEVFDKNFNGNYLSIELCKCIMLNIVSTMIKTVNQLNKIYDNGFLEKLNPVGKLLRCHNVKEMENELDVILKDFCSYTDIMNKQESNIFKNEIMNYITNNYKDPNLNITMLADKFNMHPVYMSKAFSENVGEGMLDCINKLRIKEAKKLIRETNYNMEYISEAIGYSNSRTFTREFKKYEGITPGKYREMK